MSWIITKIFLILLIWVSWYGLSVFVLPEVAASIDSLIGVPWLSDTIRWSKLNFDTAITDIPNLQQIRSWATDMWIKISDGIDTTKETIDTIRSWAQKAGDTYNNAKDTIDWVKNTLSWATQTINDINVMVESINSISTQK